MSCPVCGDRCTCPRPGDSGAETSILVDPDLPEILEEQFERSLDEGAEREPQSPYTDREDSNPAAQQSLIDHEPWRREVASRVDAFCARRGRKRGPRLASLNLEFGPLLTAAGESATRPCTSALAEQIAPQQIDPETSNLIEFPRPLTPPPPPAVQLSIADELAEPIIQVPRILEAEPEEIGLLFGGQPMPSITLETPAPPPTEVYPEPATVSHRAIAGLLDTAIVLTASGAFATIVTRIAGTVPHTRSTLAAALTVPAMLWALYEYIFWVYAGATVGVRLTRLELRTFDNAGVPRRTRRWRAIATMVSAMSLGMGFLWAVIDEDGLCWHDRISRTLLRPR